MGAAVKDLGVVAASSCKGQRGVGRATLKARPEGQADEFGVEERGEPWVPGRVRGLC